MRQYDKTSPPISLPLGKMSLTLLLTFLLTFLTIQTNAVRETSVLTKISEDTDLTYFNDLLETSGAWKNSLFYSKVTVFAPIDKAFRRFNGRITQNLTSYHIVYSNYHLDDLVDGNLESINHDLPPLWVTRRDEEIFVNNALILREKSDFAARNNQFGKHQILHFVDRVLDPVISGNVKPTAYDFLSKTRMFTNVHKCKKFFSKVIQYHTEALYKNQGGYTFFIPVDTGIDEFRFNSIDSHIVKAHIIRHKVVFLRPSLKNHYYNTSADDNYINILISIQDSETNSYTVMSNTVLGDSNHRTGEIKADIIMGNIPVKNGVIHIISRPLGVFDQKLTMFPYLEVKDKFSMDPYLNTSYFLGSRSGFNSYLNNHNKKFTFFIPRDAAWKNMSQWFDINVLLKPSFIDLTRNIMSRHLIVGDVPYLMETLVEASKDGCMQLMTPNGRTCLGAYRMDDGRYFIKWNEIYIDVYRPNFECSNGIVHVIDKPFISSDDIRLIPKKSISNFQLWGAILNILFSKHD